MTPRTRNRLKLVGIGALAALPVVASYVLYWFWTPGAHTNYGTLLEPRRLPDVELQAADGEPFSFASLRGRWILLVVDGGGCGPRCQEKIWQVRQIRQAQGKEMNRVERVWLIDDGEPADTRTVQAYPGMHVARAGMGLIGAALPAQTTARDHVYLVDPLGNVMLRFPPAAEPKRMIADLARLLKYSRTG